MIFLVSGHAVAERLVFENVNVIPMDWEHILKNQRVIVEGKKITAIEPVTTKLMGKADEIIDCHGSYMIPGLADTHYHQTGKDEGEYQLLYNLLIANGVTSVRSMAEWKGQDVIAMRENTKRKGILAPYFYTVGPQLESEAIKTPEDAVKAVQYHKERGYDFIKVHGNLPKNAYLRLLDESEKAAIPVVGHAQRNLPLEYSLRLTSIAHMEELVMVPSDEENLKVVDIDDALAESIAEQVKNSGIYVSPTLSIVALIQDYTDDERYEKLKTHPEVAYLAKKTFRVFTKPGASYRSEFFMSEFGINYLDKVIKGTQKLTLALYKAGVPMLVGSDNFGFQITGFSVHNEMTKMNEAGMSPYDVLKAATVTSARYLKRQAVAGTINEGKNAEFILLAKNPLEDINNTRSIQGVMLKGQWLNRKKLDGLLSEVISAREKEE